jgi:hypothetical protein
MWKDATRYDRYDTDPTPKTWALSLGQLRLSVTTDDSRYPGRWVFNCTPFYQYYLLADANNVQDAQTEALRLVSARIDEVVKALDAALAPLTQEPTP